MRELDRNKIKDGDILEIDLTKNKGNEPMVWFTLSHRANGIDIGLTKLELEWLLSKMKEG